MHSKKSPANLDEMKTKKESRRNLLLGAAAALPILVMQGCGVRRFETEPPIEEANSTVNNEPPAPPTPQQSPAPVARGAWSVVTTEVVGMPAVMQAASSAHIFVRIGNQVCEWINNAFQPVSADDINILTGFHVHGSTQKIVYSVYNNATEGICKSVDGAAFAPLTPSVPPPFTGWGQSGEHIVVVREDCVYANVGTAVCKWDGTAWTQVTPPTTGADPTYFSIEDDGNGDVIVIQKVGQQYCCYLTNPQNQKVWVPLTPSLPAGVDISAQFHVASFGTNSAGENKTQVFARVGKQICESDGKKWIPVSPDIDGFRGGPVSVTRLNNVLLAHIGDRICKWTG